MIIEEEELQSLVPHRGKMFLLSRITEYNVDERSLAAEYDIKKNCIFYESGIGGVPGWTGFELIAQAISALSGMDSRQKGEKPKIGFILSVSGMKICIPVFPPDETVKIKIIEDYRMDMIYTYCGQVFLGGKMAVEAKLTVMNVMEKDFFSKEELINSIKN
jgi:predicted hotdog family 3-hydroxylacyl-ACP dehydratase